jgi:aspartate racemase
MKTIGIVGGIAWPSSIVYYRLINEMVSERLGDGGLHSARLVLAEADFDEIERCHREGRWDCVGEILAAEGEILAAEGEKLRLAGAHFFLLACNTVHIAARQVEGSVDLPFLHIVDATAERALAQGHSTVGLLGSRYTMYGDYFVGRLGERYGLEVVVAKGQHPRQCTTHCMRSWQEGSSCRRPEKARMVGASRMSSTYWFHVQPGVFFDAFMVEHLVALVRGQRRRSLLGSLVNAR